MEMRRAEQAARRVEREAERINLLREAERRRAEEAARLRLDRARRVAEDRVLRQRAQTGIEERAARERAQAAVEEAAYEAELRCVYDATMPFSHFARPRVRGVHRSICVYGGREFDAAADEYVNITPTVLWQQMRPACDGKVVLPVTVTDYAGRFLPTVVLAEADFGSPGHVRREVARRLAAVHELAHDERLEFVKPLRGHMKDTMEGYAEPSSLFVPVCVGPSEFISVYRGAMALEMARRGVMRGWCPKRHFPDEHALCMCVVPRAAPVLLTLDHCVADFAEGEGPERAQRPRRTLAATGAPVLVASDEVAAVRAALSPFLGGQGEELPPEVVVEHEAERTRNLMWSGALPALHRRNVVVDPGLEAALREQARFAEVHDYVASVVRNMHVYSEIIVDPPVPLPRTFRYRLTHPVLFDYVLDDARNAAVAAAAPPEGGRGVRVYFGLRLRVFEAPLRDAMVPPHGALFALTATSGAWDAPAARAFRAMVAEHEARPERDAAGQAGGSVMTVATEPWVLRSVEDASGALEEAEQPDDVVGVALNSAQLRSLAFMQASEDGPPLWSRMWRTHPDVLGAFSPFFRTPAKYGAWASPDAAREGAARRTRGGIVGNAAGTGKTILAVALILSRPPAPDAEARATLVLCPPTVVAQWMGELARVAPVLDVVAMRAGEKPAAIALALRGADVVVCGFPQMLKHRANALAAVRWHRVVVDEGHLAHGIGEGIAADRVWFLTGTPMRDGVSRNMGNMFAALGLGGDPTPVWNGNMRVTAASSIMESGFALAAMSEIMVRFLGEPRIESDEAILVDVPGGDGGDVAAAYRELEEESIGDFRRATTYDVRFLGRPVLRLARFCAGVRLPGRLVAVVRPPRPAAANPAAAVEVPLNLVYDEARHGVGFNDPAVDACSVCLEPMVFARAAMTPCRHWFCMVCVATAVARNRKCPTCRKDVALGALRLQPDLAEAAEPDAEGAAGEDEEPAAVAEAGGDAREAASRAMFDAKVAAVVAYARSDEVAGEKFIVFTRHTALARRYADALTAAGVRAVHFTRSLSEEVRNAEKWRFQTDDAVRAIVIDLKNAEGIDGLQVARRVVFSEPLSCSDTAKRVQAISRCDRMGQERPVIVRTLAMRGTAEERIASYVPQARPAAANRRVREAGTTLARRQLRAYLGIIA